MLIDPPKPLHSDNAAAYELAIRAGPWRFDLAAASHRSGVDLAGLALKDRVPLAVKLGYMTWMDAVRARLRIEVTNRPDPALATINILSYTCDSPILGQRYMMPYLDLISSLERTAHDALSRLHEAEADPTISSTALAAVATAIEDLLFVIIEIGYDAVDDFTFLLARSDKASLTCPEWVDSASPDILLLASDAHSAIASTLQMLGRAGKVVIEKENTTIVNGSGRKEEIQGRVAQIKAQIEETTSDYDREKLQERLAKLTLP